MKETYQDAMVRLAKRAERDGDRLRARYYWERANGMACVDYDTFIHSWAGERWKATLLTE